jgi:hypothetical protein
MGTKKEETSSPDNPMVAYNPGILPYASNLGAPAIKPDDTVGWRVEQAVKTNNYFRTKYEEIREEYRQLIEQFEWNKLVYESDYRFIPVKGHTYYLYQRKNRTLFLSLISPHEWNQFFIGAFKLDSEDKWMKVEPDEPKR